MQNIFIFIIVSAISFVGRVSIGQESEHAQEKYDHTMEAYMSERLLLNRCSFSAVGWNTPIDESMNVGRFYIRIDAQIDFERDLWAWTWVKTPATDNVPLRELSEQDLQHEKAVAVHLILSQDGKYYRDLSEKVIFAENPGWEAVKGIDLFDPRTLGAATLTDIRHNIRFDKFIEMLMTHRRTVSISEDNEQIVVVRKLESCNFRYVFNKKRSFWPTELVCSEIKNGKEHDLFRIHLFFEDQNRQDVIPQMSFPVRYIYSGIQGAPDERRKIDLRLKWSKINQDIPADVFKLQSFNIEPNLTVMDHRPNIPVRSKLKLER